MKFKYHSTSVVAFISTISTPICLCGRMGRSVGTTQTPQRAVGRGIDPRQWPAQSMGSFHVGRNPAVSHQKSVDQNSIVTTMERPSISSCFSQYSFPTNPCKISPVCYISILTLSRDERDDLWPCSKMKSMNSSADQPHFRQRSRSSVSDKVGSKPISMPARGYDSATLPLRSKTIGAGDHARRYRYRAVTHRKIVRTTIWRPIIPCLIGWETVSFWIILNRF